MTLNHTSYPKGEKVWETYVKTEESRIRNEPILIITSNDRRDTYYLYSVKNGELTRLYKASSPPLLYKKYLLNGGKL